jgi:hypothetical protein
MKSTIKMRVIEVNNYTLYVGLNPISIIQQFDFNN